MKTPTIQNANKNPSRRESPEAIVAPSEWTRHPSQNRDKSEPQSKERIRVAVAESSQDRIALPRSQQASNTEESKHTRRATTGKDGALTKLRKAAGANTSPVAGNTSQQALHNHLQRAEHRRKR